MNIRKRACPHIFLQTKFPTKYAGDCEDYALLKYSLLEQSGVDPDDMRIVILTTGDGIGHAVLVVKDSATGQYYVLDNNNTTEKLDGYDTAYKPFAGIYSDGQLCQTATVSNPQPR